MIHIEITETGEKLRIENEVWITANRNGIVATPHRIKARGVGDGERIWSLGELEGYPGARIITLAEYLEAQVEEDPDPELTPEETVNIMMGGRYEAQ